MNKLLSFTAAALAVAAFASSPSFAESENWSDAKRDQVERNRTTNAGVGEGAEYDGNGNEIDPGNSAPPNNNADRNADKPATRR
jgi:hypothetical protein